MFFDSHPKQCLIMREFLKSTAFRPTDSLSFPALGNQAVFDFCELGSLLAVLAAALPALALALLAAFAGKGVATAEGKSSGC